MLDFAERPAGECVEAERVALGLLETAIAGRRNHSGVIGTKKEWGNMDWQGGPIGKAAPQGAVGRDSAGDQD